MATLDQLAATNDLDVETVRKTVQALEEELGHTIACDVCNELADPPYRTVLQYPRPWADVVDATAGDDDDGAAGPTLLCQECWATEAAHYADLTEKQAQIVALKLAGFSNDEIGTAIGRSAGSVASTLSRLKNRQLEEEFEQLERTRDVLNTIVWRG